jgi:hypothetical protein
VGLPRLIAVLVCKMRPSFAEKMVDQTAREMASLDSLIEAVRRRQRASYKELPSDFFAQPPA